MEMYTLHISENIDVNKSIWLLEPQSWHAKCTTAVAKDRTRAVDSKTRNYGKSQIKKETGGKRRE